MAKSTTATWNTIDERSLPKDILGKYDDYVEARNEANDKRKEFETALLDKLPEPPKGKRYAFGYKFGKLSMAIVDDDKSAKSSPSALSFDKLIAR